MKKNSMKASTIVALGAGAVALAASTYYLFGPEGKIHRKKATGWMIKMKGEIVEKLEEAGEVSEAIYHGIVDKVLASYAVNSKINPEDLKIFANGLKKQWKNIVKIIPKKSLKKSTGAKKGAGSKKVAGAKKSSGPKGGAESKTDSK